MRILDRTTIVGVVVAGSLIGLTATAQAATPVVKACVGTTFSSGDHGAGPGTTGPVVRGFAQNPDGRPGLGDGIQALQAGLVDPSTVGNACFTP
jgi:hypothetical protein